MPDLAGPRLEKNVDAVIDWYHNARQRLIKAMSEGRPYGTVSLNSNEMMLRFLQMQPEDYEALIYKLNDKYRGLPNAYDLVNKDLANFMARMLMLMSNKKNLSDTDFGDQYNAIQESVNA